MNGKVSKEMWALLGVYVLVGITSCGLVYEVKNYINQHAKVIEMAHEVLDEGLTELVQWRLERHEEAQREIYRVLGEIEVIMEERKEEYESNEASIKEE